MAVRKRESKITDSERQLFRSVLSTLIANGIYGNLVAIHEDMNHNQHGGMGAIGRQRFLTWHRVFLLRLEQAMQAENPAAFIPYWDWTTKRSVPQWLQSFRPTVNVPGQGAITVTREPGEPPVLPTKTHVQSILSETTFTAFTTQLEFAHNNVHGWVGGTMANIEISPADPLFWMHHAQIDRLWSRWQAKKVNKGKGPTLTGSKRVMDPWTETVDDVVSIKALGYSYGK